VTGDDQVSARLVTRAMRDAPLENRLLATGGSDLQSPHDAGNSKPSPEA
jgi:hypothetical protein